MAKKKKKKKTTAIKKVGNDNVKSFMKMNKDMNTAVFGFAQELKTRGQEITPTQLLTQSLKYLKTYAHSYGISMDALAQKSSPVERKDYSVTSAETLKRLKKQLNDEDKLTNECNREMRKHGAKRKVIRKKSAKKSAKTRKTKSPAKKNNA